VVPVRLFKKNAEGKEEMAVQVPKFGEFALEQQPGGTLKGMRSLGGDKSERVIMFYEKMPSPERGKMHFKLQRYADSEALSLLGDFRVTFRYNQEDGKWEFDKREGTLGRAIAPAEWEKMLNDFLAGKQAKKWLKEEETFGPPKKGIFQRLRRE
jgi:hypothetical protein